MEGSMEGSASGDPIDCTDGTHLSSSDPHSSHTLPSGKSLASPRRPARLLSSRDHDHAIRGLTFRAYTRAVLRATSDRRIESKSRRLTPVLDSELR
jgi:hypothetical protein